MRKLRKTKIVLELLIILIVIIAAIGCLGKEKSVVQEESVSTQTELESSEESTEEETTIEETTEEESTEEEPGTLTSCIVFDNEEYCGMGEVPCGWSEDSEIGFNLEEGTKVYAPFDGVLRIVDFVLENDQWSKGIEIVMWPIEEVSRQFLFHDIVPNPDLEKALEEESERVIEIKWAEMPEGPRTEKMIKVKKRELIGQTTEGISWTFFGKEYNFVIMILNTRDLPPYTPEYLPQFYSDMEFFKWYFPYIECEE